MALTSVDVDRLLQDTLRTMNAGWAPPCNAYEDEHGFHIQVAIPGVDRQDMQILFEDGVLTVKGERKEHSVDQVRGILPRKLGGAALPDRSAFRPISIPIRSRPRTRTAYWCWGYRSGKKPNPDALKLPNGRRGCQSGEV